MREGEEGGGGAGTCSPLSLPADCRKCGRVFCAKCAGAYVPVPGVSSGRPVRVCDACRVLLLDALGDDSDTEGGEVAASDGGLD